MNPDIFAIRESGQQRIKLARRADDTRRRRGRSDGICTALKFILLLRDLGTDAILRIRIDDSRMRERREIFSESEITRTRGDTRKVSTLKSINELLRRDIARIKIEVSHVVSRLTCEVSATAVRTRDSTASDSHLDRLLQVSQLEEKRARIRIAIGIRERGGISPHALDTRFITGKEIDPERRSAHRDRLAVVGVGILYSAVIVPQAGEPALESKWKRSSKCERRSGAKYRHVIPDDHPEIREIRGARSRMRQQKISWKLSGICRKCERTRRRTSRVSGIAFLAVTRLDDAVSAVGTVTAALREQSRLARLSGLDDTISAKSSSASSSECGQQTSSRIRSIGSATVSAGGTAVTCPGILNSSV